MKAQAATSGGDALAIRLLRNLRKIENIQHAAFVYCHLDYGTQVILHDTAIYQNAGMNKLGIVSLNPAVGSVPRHLDRRVQLKPIGGIFEVAGGYGHGHA